jgi:hypothetical protein
LDFLLNHESSCDEANRKAFDDKWGAEFEIYEKWPFGILKYITKTSIYKLFEL